MIVKNEEERLEKCLTSVKDYVDEIIIVDTGSTDGTLEIAKRFTEKLFTFNWTNNFSDARNYSIAQATSEYILIMDADEYIKEAPELKRYLKGKADCFLFNIKNHLSNGGSYTHQAYRMFKKATGLSYEGKLHEHINIDHFPEVITREIPIVIHHDGYLEGVLNDKNKKIRNIKIIEVESKEHPTAYNLYNLARAQFDLGMYEKAQHNFKKSYQLDNSKSYLPDLLNKLALSLMELRRFDDGLKVISSAITLFQNQSQLWLTKGLIYFYYGYFQDAEMMFKHCLNIVEYGYEITEGTGSYIPKLKLSEVYEERGDLLKSFEEIVEVIQEHKHYAPALVRYFEVVKKTGIPKSDIVNTLNAIYPINNDRDLNTLLISLYNTRNPLLKYYIDEYSLNVNGRIQAVAETLNNNYEYPFEFWSQLDIIPQVNYLDVISLCYVRRDDSLVDKLTSLKLNKKDKSTLKRLIKRDSITQKELSNLLLEYLVNINMRLIDMMELDDFDYIYSKYLANNQQQSIRILFAKELFEAGHVNMAETVSLNLLSSYPNSKEGLKLLADCYVRLNRYEDAINTYKRALKYGNSLSIYEKLYFLYEETGNSVEKEALLTEMKLKYSLSDWLNQLSD
ncbi:TPR domain-containing glycosyltransferase [Psychrobacillus sp. OK032]|uniref:TPR domain-containing glycosyltransferase n=1 Tax=Psychrobacillus sp. OK032 TaxID=1884358 RepID=UPI0008D5EB5D|nr:TPR domain-containing glycosyltransferase [Psychrobacillus sp. OK032]SER65342.1 Glycosyltransferase involved in cell wall bisynthesis [Psychrobacillus sp. OK032]